MHEMSIATGIRDIIEDTARSQGFRRITEIRLEIGAFSGVEVASLLFCLDVVLINTCATGAELQVEIVPGQGHCVRCNDSFLIKEFYEECPKCSSYPLRIISGMELRVKDLLIE